MKATGRLLLAVLAFVGVLTTGAPLVLLDAIALPLRFVNVRALALLEGRHAGELGE
jgi:hypothetical protein